jgi:hypothetical protein
MSENDSINDRLAASEAIETILSMPGFTQRDRQAAARQTLRADLTTLRTAVLIADPDITAAAADQRVRDIISKNGLAEAEADAAERRAAWDAENSPDALWRKAQVRSAATEARRKAQPPVGYTGTQVDGGDGVYMPPVKGS